MSNFAAIATVTGVLQRSLQGALDAAAATPGGVANATVFLDRPDTAHLGAGLHIYLVRAERNAARTNVDLPAFDADGVAVDRPSTAFDLRYVLTAFGNDAQLEPHRILGIAVARLVEHPIVTDADIADAAATFGGLAATDLADGPERVRFTICATDGDDQSRVWSPMPTAGFGPSLHVSAGAVRIEPDVTEPGPALPVTARSITAVPGDLPQIEEIAAADPTVPIVAGSTVVLTGRSLRATTTRIELDGVAVPAADISDHLSDRVSVSLPATLPAGPHTLRVVHVVGASPAGTEFVAASNLIRFGVAAVVTAVSIVGANVRVTVAPPDLPAPAPKEVLLTPIGGGTTVQLDAAFAPGQPRRVTVPVAGLASGDHLVRVRIDGVVSTPDFANPATSTVSVP